jgi:hypothetical protein
MCGTDVAVDRSALQSSPLSMNLQNPVQELIKACQQGNTPPAASRTDPGVKSEATLQPYRMGTNAS